MVYSASISALTPQAHTQTKRKGSSVHKAAGRKPHLTSTASIPTSTTLAATTTTMVIMYIITILKIIMIILGKMVLI